MNEMNELKPCPFCGGKAIVKQDGSSLYDLWIVGCDGKYGSECPGYIWKATPVYLTKGMAIYVWNRRESDG